MQTEEILFELLTKGICYEQVSSIQPINRFLIPLRFEAIQWYDKSCLVLKDSMHKIDNGIRKNLADEIKSTINSIVNGNDEYKNTNAISYLMEKRWIVVENGRIFLSPRFLIQNEEFLLESGKFVKCEFCEIVQNEGNCHTYCESLYKENLENNMSQVNKK